MGEDLKNKCSAALPTLHGCKVLRIHGKRGSCSELSGILVSSGITCPTSNYPASPSVAAPAVSSLPRGEQKCSVLPLVGRACRGQGVMCSLGTLRHIPFTGKRELPNLLGCEKFPGICNSISKDTPFLQPVCPLEPVVALAFFEYNKVIGG